MSNIEWTERTWNPLAGCTEVSPGCANCYAAFMAKRLEAMGQQKYAGLTRTHENGKVVWTGKVTLDHEALHEPLRRRKPTKYFVNSMSDLFHEDVSDRFIDLVFAVMACCQRHIFQVLTKRPRRMLAYILDLEHKAALHAPDTISGKLTVPQLLNMRAMMSGYGMPGGVLGEAISPSTPWPLPNAWLGVSVEDQARADERMTLLAQTPTAVRFLSCEPLLESLKLGLLLRLDSGTYKCADWVIVGGESQQGKSPPRPCDVSWLRWIVRQCKEAGVPVFVKQLGGNVIDAHATSATHFPEEQCWPAGTKIDHHSVRLRDRKGGNPEEWPRDLRVREFPKGD